MPSVTGTGFLTRGPSKLKPPAGPCTATDSQILGTGPANAHLLASRERNEHEAGATQMLGRYVTGI